LRFSSAKWLVLMMMAWSTGCGQGRSKQESASPTGEIETTQQAVTGAFCAGVTADFCDDFQDGNATSPAWTVRDQAVASDLTVVTDGDYVYKPRRQRIPRHTAWPSPPKPSQPRRVPSVRRRSVRRALAIRHPPSHMRSEARLPSQRPRAPVRAQ